MGNNEKNTTKKSSSTFMDMVVDYAFKRVLGSPHNKHILIDMLNAFLSDYVGEITDIDFLPLDQLGITPRNKKVSYDIYGKEGTERHFLLEMQHGRQTFYSRRAVAYVSRAVSNELRKGDRKYNFPSVISLNFLDYHDPKIMRNSGLIQRVALKNEENEIFSEKIMFFFVDLSIFANGKRPVEFSDRRQKWAYYIKNIGRMSEGEVKGETGIFREFIEECRMSNLNETEMREYNKSILEYDDVRDACVAAREDGYAEGEAIGYARGEARGEAKGEARGRAEAERKIAFEMLKKGIPLSLVSEISGLPESELLALDK